jgi:anti-sigma factor (TIGR02949 family)
LGLKDIIEDIKMRTGLADCGAYKELIDTVIDNEATEQQEAYLRSHFEKCVCCLNQYNVDKELKELLCLKLHHKEVPEGLVESIRGKLARKA